MTRSSSSVRRVPASALPWNDPPATSCQSLTSTVATAWWRRRAMASTSMSKPQPSIVWRPKMSSAASALKSLKPHCESLIPGRSTARTSRLPSWDSQRRGPVWLLVRSRTPMTTALPSSTRPSATGRWCNGVARSASMKMRRRPRAASMPARASRPLPFCRPGQITRRCSNRARLPSTMSTVRSQVPSGRSAATTTTSTPTKPDRARKPESSTMLRPIRASSW